MRRALATSCATLLLGLTGCASDVDPVRLAGPEPLTATFHVTPRTASFGDPVVATVRVLYDPARVDGSSVRLATRVDPWRETRTVEREAVRGLEALTYTLRLTCLTGPCASEERQARYFLTDAELTWREAGRRRLQLLPWPELEIATRLPRSYVAPGPGDRTPLPWRAAVDVPAPSYRLEPARLRLLLLAAGALLIAGSLALAAAALRRPRPARELPPLERALAQLERARTAEDRRAALEAVAHELHPALAAAARELAWSEEEPTQPAAQELTARLRGAGA